MKRGQLAQPRDPQQIAARRSRARRRRTARAGDPALHAALKAWRSEIARKRGVPAYVVLHDSTIDGIAASRPATLNELRGIAGIGDKKLEHYGEELIALVKAGLIRSLICAHGPHGCHSRLSRHCQLAAAGRPP